MYDTKEQLQIQFDHNLTAQSELYWYQIPHIVYTEPTHCNALSLIYSIEDKKKPMHKTMTSFRFGISLFGKMLYIMSE